jgi:hypothetical protein
MAEPTIKKIQTTLDFINLANSAIPGVLKIINMLRDADPGMTVGEFRKQSDDVLVSNLQMIQEWKKDHPES